MAATTITEFPIPDTTPAISVTGARSKRRHISPRAGRALGILGHAIEYLTDEFIHEAGTFSADNPQMEAVQLLMALNRKVYFECPEVPSFGERWRVLVRSYLA